MWILHLLNNNIKNEAEDIWKSSNPTWAIWPIPVPLSSYVARQGHATGHRVWIFSSYMSRWRCQRNSKQTPQRSQKCWNTYHCWYEPATGRSGSRAHPLPAYCSWEWAWQVAALVESPLLLNVKITMLKSGDMVYMLRREVDGMR